VDIRDIEDLPARQEQAIDALEQVAQLDLVGVVTVESNKEIVRRNAMRVVEVHEGRNWMAMTRAPPDSIQRTKEAGMYSLYSLVKVMNRSSVSTGWVSTPKMGRVVPRPCCPADAWSFLLRATVLVLIVLEREAGGVTTHSNMSVCIPQIYKEVVCCGLCVCGARTNKTRQR
jgi:hypothetical protein